MWQNMFKKNILNQENPKITSENQKNNGITTNYNNKNSTIDDSKIIENQIGNSDTDKNSKTQNSLIFHCQLAHGSPTGLISGFSNVKELYSKIAEVFEIPANEIIFCTLNSPKVDMKKLLGGQIGLDDFIFAHRRGRPKEVEVIKSEESLGLTITDNGAGFSFIKRIKPGSIVDQIGHISVGDQIEKLEGVNCIGRRHYEVAKMLKDISVGTTFTIRLVEPMKNGFNSVGPRSNPGKAKKNYGSGKETLRFKADGKAAIQEKDDFMDIGIDQINNKLETYLGINDSELATQIWEHAAGKTNSMDFADSIDASDLGEFGFTTDFIIEMWGVITDVRAGRIK